MSGDVGEGGTPGREGVIGALELGGVAPGDSEVARNVVMFAQVEDVGSLLETYPFNRKQTLLFAVPKDQPDAPPSPGERAAPDAAESGAEVPALLRREESHGSAGCLRRAPSGGSETVHVFSTVEQFHSSLQAMRLLEPSSPAGGGGWGAKEGTEGEVEQGGTPGRDGGYLGEYDVSETASPFREFGDEGEEVAPRSHSPPDKRPPSPSDKLLRTRSMLVTQPFTHQAGGARVLRKLQGPRALVAKPCCRREAWFYKTVRGGIRDFAPKFHGIKRDDKGVASVLLEDLTQGYTCPCVLDVKMGVCTAAPDRVPAKRERCVLKDTRTTTGSIGARICGLRAYQVVDGGYKMLDKHEGNKLSFEEFPEAISQFFHNGARMRRRLALRFLERLQPIARLMEGGGDHRLYASSILFIYEGWEAPSGGGGGGGDKDEQDGGGEEDALHEGGKGGGGRRASADATADSGRAPKRGWAGEGGVDASALEGVALGWGREGGADEEARIDVKMIDFAHVFPIGTGHGVRDESYVAGLANFMAVLEGVGNGVPAREITLVNHSGNEALHVHVVCGPDPCLPELHYQASFKVIESPPANFSHPGTPSHTHSPKALPARRRSQTSPAAVPSTPPPHPLTPHKEMPSVSPHPAHASGSPGGARTHLPPSMQLPPPHPSTCELGGGGGGFQLFAAQVDTNACI